MRTLLRLILSAAILAGAAWAAMQLTVPAVRCNRIRQRVATRTELLPTLSRFHKLDLTRENLEELRPCAASSARAVEDYLLIAENERARELNDQVVVTLEEAIRYEPRPEIYYSLAEAQLNAHQREAALQSLRMSGYAASYVHNFPDPEMRHQVQTEMLQREQRLRARIQK